MKIFVFKTQTHKEVTLYLFIYLLCNFISIFSYTIGLLYLENSYVLVDVKIKIFWNRRRKAELRSMNNFQGYEK